MTDKKELYAFGEPGLSYDHLEVDEGWKPCFEQKLAKEIGEMSDEAVEVAVKKYFGKNPCNQIEIGIMDFDALQKELEIVQSLHKVAVRERDYERTLCDNYKKDYYEIRSLYESVLSRINKLEDDTRAAIEFNEDVLHDDAATLMILEFCEDITKLVGE